MSVTVPEAMGNRLLGLLEPDTLGRALPKLDYVALLSRQPIYREDSPIDHVYFPIEGMISLVTQLADGMQAEVGMVGRDGVLGLDLVAGATSSFVEAMVQMPGAALRMAAADFNQMFERDAGFRTVVLRFNGVFQIQVMQTAACNSRHELGHRLARWLLMCRDWQDSDILPLTQEFIAMMLGVHRPSLTVAAGTLQRAGLITYSNGRITITDRTGLEHAACECYATVRRRSRILLAEAVRPDADEAA